MDLLIIYSAFSLLFIAEKFIPSAFGKRVADEPVLFFDGVWTGDGTALVIPVKKPSYKPDFANARRENISGLTCTGTRSPPLAAVTRLTAAGKPPAWSI